MSSVVLLFVVCFVSLVYGIYQCNTFIFKGYIAYSSRPPAIEEILAPTEVNTLPFCASQCIMHPQCKAIEICPQRETRLCRLCNFINLTFTENDTDACRHLQMVTERESCSNNEDICTTSEVRNCKEILNNANHTTVSSGVYTIYIDNKPTNVWCDMEIDGGGWTVIQKRQNGKTDFNRTWNDYKAGFGNASDEYWIGNDALHKLTANKTLTLRVELERFNGTKGYGTYSTFTVANETLKYTLSLSGYNGNINNCLAYNNGYNFTTKDKDNDKKPDKNCAVLFHSGWWHQACTKANLNGQYYAYEKTAWDSMFCWQWMQSENIPPKALKGSKMMIR